MSYLNLISRYLYYAAPKPKRNESLDEVDPEILKTFEKLGVPIEEQKDYGVAVDVVMDSVSVAKFTIN